VLNVVCAVRAALNGADADAAVLRAFLIGIRCPDPFAVVDDLTAHGLLPTG
jgi:hypothetical protein